MPRETSFLAPLLFIEGQLPPFLAPSVRMSQFLARLQCSLPNALPDGSGMLACHEKQKGPLLGLFPFKRVVLRVLLSPFFSPSSLVMKSLRAMPRLFSWRGGPFLKGTSLLPFWQRKALQAPLRLSYVSFFRSSGFLPLPTLRPP